MNNERWEVLVKYTTSLMSDNCNTANKTDREIAKLLKGIDGQNIQFLSCLMHYILNVERKVFKEVSKVSDMVLLS